MSSRSPRKPLPEPAMNEQTRLSSRLVYALAAIVILAPTQFAIEVMKKNYLSLVDPLVWLVFCIWLIGAVKSGTLRTLKIPLVFPVLFVALSALSLIHTPNPIRSASKIAQLAEYFIAAFILFSAAMADEKARKTILNTFLVVSSVVILLGVVQYFRSGVTDFQVKATFGNSNVFGGFLSLALPLMFGLSLCETSVKRRIWFLLIIGAGLVATLSGGTFLAVALAFAVLSMARGWKYFAGYAVLLLLAVFIVLPNLPRHNLTALKDSIAPFNENGDLSRRYAEWQAAVEMTQEHPLLGVGSGCYQEKIGAFYGVIPVVGGTAAQADSQNLFLVLSSSVGLPGLIAFLGLLLFSAAQAARGLAGSAEAAGKGLYLGVLGSLIAFSVNSIWSPLLVRGIGIPLVIILTFAFYRKAVTATPPQV